MNKPRTKITEPMSAEDRDTLQKHLDDIYQRYQRELQDAVIRFTDAMEHLESAIRAASVTSHEAQD